MARTYKPATFQPTVRPDWGGALSYLPESEKAEILEAIIKYPSKDCNSAFWLETIKPDLDFQYETFVGACKKKSQGIRDRWGKISTTYLQHMNNISTTDVQDMNKISDTYVIDVEEKDKNKDKEEDKNKYKNKIDIYTRFNAGFQNWKFEPAILKVAKKHWTAESIRNIERDFSCNEYNTETNIADLLERYPSDKVPFKILGEKQTIALTKKQWDWFQSQGIAPAVKIKAIDLLEDYSFSNPKRFKEYTDLSVIIGRSTGWAYKEAFKDPYVFENQEHLIAELKRVGLK